MAWIVGLCPGSMTITGWVEDDPVERDVDGLGVGREVVEEALDRGCGLVVRRDVVGVRVRLEALVVAEEAGVGVEVDVEVVEGDPFSVALLGLFVGRELPHAPAVITVTSASATPTPRRRAYANGGRDARVLTRPR